jgi:uncharacterized repeat protein (TIGR04042 family)
MPALDIDIEWPDGDVMKFYSPSTILLKYFQEGNSLTIRELINLSEEAFNAAGLRVEEVFGFLCTEAESQRDKIIKKAKLYEDNDKVIILEIKERPK